MKEIESENEKMKISVRKVMKGRQNVKGRMSEREEVKKENEKKFE